VTPAEVQTAPSRTKIGSGSSRTAGWAGVTAGIDLALALVEEDLGRDHALAVARQLVVYLNPSPAWRVRTVLNCACPPGRLR
jgi:transcriptional regulator GlxA family with amidase domain